MIHWYKTFWKSESWKVSLIWYFFSFPYFFLNHKNLLKAGAIESFTLTGSWSKCRRCGTCQWTAWQSMSSGFATSSGSDLGGTLSSPPALDLHLLICPRRGSNSVTAKAPPELGALWLIVTYPSLTQSRNAYTPGNVQCVSSPKEQDVHIPPRVFKWTFFVILDGVSKGCQPQRIPCADAGSPERLAAGEEKWGHWGECCPLSRAYGVLGRGVSASWPPSPLLPHCFPCPAFAGPLERLERFAKCFLKSDNFSKWSSGLDLFLESLSVIPTSFWLLSSDYGDCWLFIYIKG